MSDIKDIETDAVNIDGSENVGTQGIEEANSEAAKAMRKLKDARDKDAGPEKGRGGGGLGIGKVIESLGDGRDR